MPDQPHTGEPTRAEHPGDLIHASAVLALRGDLETIIEQDAEVGNDHTQVLAKQIVKKLNDALSDRAASPPHTGEARVCEHAHEGATCPICRVTGEARVGICGRMSPADRPCSLPAGHAGWHHADDGSDWNRSPLEPASTPEPPEGDE